MTIGERLKELRGARSRREVAEIIGMKQQAWEVYENDRSAPGAKLLIKIARAFGVSTDWLLGIDEKRQSVVANNSAVVIGNGTATVHAAGEAAICRKCPIRKKLEALERLIGK